MSVLTSSSIKKVGALFVSEHRLYVDANVKICQENDPKVARMICPAGGSLSESSARKYGLLPKVESPEAIAGRETRVPKNLATR